MSRRREIRLAVVGDITSYAQALVESGQYTEKQAAAMARSWATSHNKIAVESAKAAKASATQWRTTMGAAAALVGADFARQIGGWVVDQVRELEEVRRELVRMSEDTGIAAERLDAIRLAAQRSGEDFEPLVDAARDFGEVMFDFADRGAGRAEETFRILGYSQEELRDRLGDVDGVFAEVIDKVRQMDNDGMRVAATQQLMSDHGAKLLRVLGDRGWDDWLKFAREFGVDVGPEAAKAVRQWDKALGDLKLAASSAAGDLLGVFGYDSASQFIQNFTLGFVGAEKYVTEWAKNLLEDVRILRDAVADAWKGEGKLRTQTVMVDMQGNFEESDVVVVDKLTSAVEHFFSTSDRGSAAAIAALEKMRTLWKQQQDDYDGGRSGGSGTFTQAIAEDAKKAEDAVKDLDAVMLKAEETAEEFKTALELIPMALLDTTDVVKTNLDTVLGHYGFTGEFMKEAHAEALGGIAAISDDIVGNVTGTLRNLGREHRGAAMAAWFIEKAAALSRIALLAPQAILQYSAQLGPAGAGAAGLLVATQAAAALSVPPPTFHTGDYSRFMPAQSYMSGLADEYLARIKRHETLVDAPTTAAVGGPERVREIVKGGGRDRYFVFHMGDMIELAVEEVSARVAPQLRGRPMGSAPAGALG